MKYEIFGENLPGVQISLDYGESIYTQSGCMAWMSDQIEMTTNMSGGFMKGLGRLFSGDSMFQAVYTAQAPEQNITLSTTLPGTIMALQVDDDHTYIGQRGSFLAASPEVSFQAAVTNAKAGLFGGEGFILQHFTGSGLLLVELDGSVQTVDLLPDQQIVVSSSHVALFEEKVKYDVKTVKGFKNVLFGGEGLFLTTLTGPGRIWLQTMTVRALANQLIPYLPTSSSHND
jgi:uncharacterized protein (TIGR00266 family)